MKILCPVDFSQNSLNAAIWASALLKDLDPNGEIKFLHCANIRRRAEMFLKIDHILRQNAESD